MRITDDIIYVGVNDHDVDLFEGQYKVPNGMSYNSYVILDDKIAVMDTVDANFTHEWLDNVASALGSRRPNYLVIQHMEPDHSANIVNFLKTYPNASVVSNKKAFAMMENFFGADFCEKRVIVADGETLDLGKHKLTFVFAPMVHWPEVMVTYESKEKVLFSADGFGKFGALDTDEDWACEARRYYFNICGKYGVQVQALLKKAAKLDIEKICPLHGPVLTENLGYYINLYDIWSKYEPEVDGIFIAYCSIHGNTEKAALKLYDILKEKTDKKIAISDLSRSDMAENVEDAFKYSTLVVAAPSYDGGVFPVMNDFLHHLKIKGYKNRKVAMIENGSWAPCAIKSMQPYFDEMKGIEISDAKVTIRSTMTAENEVQLAALADSII